MAVPYWIALSMCVYDDSKVVWGFLQVDSWDVSEAPGWCWAIPVHFMVPGISSSVIVVVLYCGGLESVSPTIIFNILWLIRPFLQIIEE